jgi:cob(I)alamin adenosyltransferase
LKIYTKTGDDGTTGLLGQQRVRKDHGRIEASGLLDEANAQLGTVLGLLPTQAHRAQGWLDSIQDDLFVVGALLAAPKPEDARVALTPARVEALENAIDEMEKDLPPLKNFILPRGTPAAAHTHLARAVCRRAERGIVALAGYDTVDPLVLAFLNRLSDFLFVLARWVNRQEGGTETAWIGRAASGEKGKPTPPAPGQGDRLSATLQKLEDEKRKRQTLFEKASSDLQKKRENAEKAFKDSVDQIKKDGGTVERPVRDVDLD